MKKHFGLAALILSFSAMPLALHAQDEAEVEEEETMETVEQEDESLSLPDDASEEGKTNSAYGLETANEARDGGREFGESQAESARGSRGDAGRETGAEARGDAGRPE